jgi:hypothetical protein
VNGGQQEWREAQWTDTELAENIRINTYGNIQGIRNLEDN